MSNVRTKKREAEVVVKLTEKELIAIGEDAAKTGEEVVNLKKDLKSVQSKYKTEIEGKEDHLHAQLRLLRTKKDFKQLVVVDHMDFDTGRVDTFTEDGSEFVSSRAMTSDERQVSLFPIAGEKK